MKNFDTDRIDQYLRKELSPEEVIAFEADMQSDEELAGEVELRRTLIAGIHHHHREKLRAIFEEEESKIQTNTSENETKEKSKGKIRYLRPLSFIIAAAAIVLIFILLRPISLPPAQSSPEEMFNQFAMHYSGGDLIQRNVDTCLRISDAINAYDQKKYATAIPMFQNMLADTSFLQACEVNQKDIELLLAISGVFEGNMEMARPMLQELSVEMETARWYLLLSYVKEGNWEEVKRRMDDWKTPSNFYKQRIEELRRNLPGN